jgi:hypothetical protein
MLGIRLRVSHNICLAIAIFCLAYDVPAVGRYIVLRANVFTYFQSDDIAGDLLVGDDALLLSGRFEIAAEQLPSDGIAYKGCYIRLKRFTRILQ